MTNRKITSLLTLITIALGLTAANWLIAAQAVPQTAPPIAAQTNPETFKDVSITAGITATHRGSWRLFRDDFTTGYLGIGQAWGDYDNDGWLDLYVSGNLTTSILYHNNGDATFSPSPFTNQVSLPNTLTGGVVWADYDNDGWRDLYVLRHGANILFHNQQGQGFVDVTAQASVGDTGKGHTATWGDYDNDGYLDLYVTNWSCHPECNPIDHNLAQDRLYHNNGDGTFSDVSTLLVHEKLLGSGFAASFVDYDNDGDSDIYVVNDAFVNPIGNVLWRNDGPGCGGWCWTDAPPESGADILIEGMGLAVGDYDNDLDLDFYFSNMVNPMALLQNQGNSTFIEVAKSAGVDIGFNATVGWGTVFMDYDNDGWLDLYLSATEFRNYDRETSPDGMHFPKANALYRNNGDQTFSDVTPISWLESPQRSMGAAYADYDQDGWLDLVVGNWNSGYSLYHNQGKAIQAQNWLTVRLTGGGPVNRDAVGARVYLTRSDGKVLLQEVINGSSLGAGNDTALHFGLAQTEVAALRIRWPNGVEHTFNNVANNQIWSIDYEAAAQIALRQRVFKWGGVVLGAILLGGMLGWLYHRKQKGSNTATQ